MGGFSSNYEGGYEDVDGLPKWMNAQSQEKDDTKHKCYKETKTSNHKYIKVLLSHRGLCEEEVEKRESLCQYCESDIFLLVKHQRDNIEDTKVLALYYEDVFIGTIQKYFQDEGIDNTRLVNNFCFEQESLREIEALWDGLHFYLKKKHKAKS